MEISQRIRYDPARMDFTRTLDPLIDRWCQRRLARYEHS
jgi:hypothetical protein